MRALIFELHPTLLDTHGLVSAIRVVDPDHVVFLDGNTYATEFDVFDEPFENAVYTLHDYMLLCARDGQLRRHRGFDDRGHLLLGPGIHHQIGHPLQPAVCGRDQVP